MAGLGARRCWTRTIAAAVALGVIGLLWAASAGVGVSAQTPTSTPTTTSPDRAALIALFKATNGANWMNGENWLSDKPIGEWSGVIADADSRVAALDLSNNNLRGAIPPEIGDMSKLTSLDLSGNDLSGKIPAAVGNLVILDSLNLADNRLSGQIPPSLGGIINLKLSLSGNEFTGCLPPILWGAFDEDPSALGLPICQLARAPAPSPTSAPSPTATPSSAGCSVAASAFGVADGGFLLTAALVPALIFMSRRRRG